MTSEGLRFDELLLDYSALPEPGSYEARDGAHLPYRTYPSSRPGDPSLHVVLLHGSGYHSRYLMPLAQEIARSSVASVYTPDLRGHGIAPIRRGDVDYVDQLEDDVADLLAEIRRLHSGARIVVGGHSSGGGLALRVAGGRYGGEAAGYVLLAPYLAHDAPTAREGSGGWARPKVPRIVALSILAGFGIDWGQQTTVIEFDMPESVRDGTETLAYSYRLNTGFAPRDYAADLAAIRVPLLVLVGADDEAFVATAYAGAVGKHVPDARVRLLGGVSHMGVVVGPKSAAEMVTWLRGL